MRLNPGQFYEAIVQPSFADFLDDYTGAYNGILHEFTVWDDVSLANGTPIIDLFSKSLMLKRKEASCKTDWSTLGHGDTRKITVTEIYEAVEDCLEEFYQGCLKDFRGDDTAKQFFLDQIRIIFLKQVRLSLAVNSYFGNVARPADPTETWSWSIFDGIFTKIAEYITKGTIPASQALSMPTGALTPAQVKTKFDEMFAARPDILRMQFANDTAFYVSENVALAWEDYLIATGANSCCGVKYLQDGIPTLKYKNVPIFVEPLWGPVLTAINGGTEANAAILTVRGNFIFGTNKKYGIGPKLNHYGLRVWYSDDDEVWKYKMGMVAGTDLMRPQLIVIATV